MADPKPYRAGLGLPSAITITSHGVPLPLPDVSIIPETDSSRPAISVYLPKSRYPQGYASYSEWKDWHINPTQHGPENRKRPPVFVSATTDYDELGRSVLHGVGVEVDEGEDGRVEGREDGTKVAEWYTSLAGGTSAMGIGEEKVEENQAGPSKPRNRSPVIIDLTDDIEDDIVTPTSVASTPAASDGSNPVQKPTIRVHSNEWFIRRALASSSTSSFPSRPPKPTSISNLLNITPCIQNRSKEPVYVLGPDNKGHQLLREQLGWGGGGLGRPEGWEGEVRDVQGRHLPRNVSIHQREEQEIPRGDGSRNSAIVVDDSDDPDSSASSSDTDDNNLHGPIQNIGGPGRTAPIATTLKLDRLGLGHRLSRDRPKSKPKSKSTNTGKSPAEDERGNSRKKVTHTHEEILEAQRRARYSLAGARNKGKVELGKKGKIKWGERDKRERDERRRMIAALNE